MKLNVNWAKEIRDINWYVSGGLTVAFILTWNYWFIPAFLIQHVSMSFIEGFISEHEKVSC